MAREIQPRKWYYLFDGFGGSNSRHVAAVAPTGDYTGGDGVFCLFGNRSGETMRPLPRVPVWEAIDEEGATCHIDANDLDGVGIGSIREDFDHAPDLTDERLVELREIGRRNAADEKAAQELAAQKRAAEVQRLRREYAYLPNKGEYIRVAKVAQNLRVELKRKMPGVKFSVTSKTFSGGDDITVTWCDGPTLDEVRRIADKYQHSHADAETGDYWDYDPSAFTEVFGGTKFMNCERHMSAETAATLYAEIGEKWTRETDSERQRIHRAFQKTPLPVGAKVTGKAFDDDAHEYRITYAAPATPEDRGVVFGVSAMVSENREKNGIEIRFKAKPPAAVLADLKAHGWRWSRFSENAFARSISTPRYPYS